MIENLLIYFFQYGPFGGGVAGNYEVARGGNPKGYVVDCEEEDVSDVGHEGGLGQNVKQVHRSLHQVAKPHQLTLPQPNLRLNAK